MSSTLYSRCRDWPAWGRSRALLLGCCASLGCTPLDNLDRYSSGGAGLGGAATTGNAAGSSNDSQRPDAGLGAEPASRVEEDAAPPAGEDPPLASDASSAGASELRISSSVPADGATGVRRDTSLSIAFSQPMDRASVEAAFASDSLPAAVPEFHWDSAGMLLNIVLGAPLAYATGDEQVSALRYDYRVSSLAHDLAGHTLPETRVSFSTLREIHVGLSASSDPALTGNWRSDGLYGTDTCAQAGGNLCVGDSSFGPNASYRGFVSFDLSALAAAGAELIQANFGIQVVSLLGDPFGSLGQLALERATFGAIGPDAFLAPAQASVGAVVAGQAGQELNIDVLGAARADLTARGRTQYRWLFQNASDGDASTDLLFFNRTSATLRVAYLVP